MHAPDAQSTREQHVAKKGALLRPPSSIFLARGGLRLRAVVCLQRLARAKAVTLDTAPKSSGPQRTKVLHLSIRSAAARPMKPVARAVLRSVAAAAPSALASHAK